MKWIMVYETLNWQKKKKVWALVLAKISCIIKTTWSALNNYKRWTVVIFGVQIIKMVTLILVLFPPETSLCILVSDIISSGLYEFVIKCPFPPEIHAGLQWRSVFLQVCGNPDVLFLLLSDAQTVTDRIIILLFDPIICQLKDVFCY